MKLGAGICTAARPERSLISRMARAIGEPIEGVIQRHRMIALALGDREKPGLGAGRRMSIDRPPVSDDKALGAERFQPDVIGTRCDRALDASGQQLLEGGEEDVLQLDGERQQPVEEGRDRRQLVLQPIGIRQLQAGRVLKPLERAAVDLAPRPAACRAGATHRGRSGFRDCPRAGTGPALRSGAGRA